MIKGVIIFDAYGIARYTTLNDIDKTLKYIDLVLPFVESSERVNISYDRGIMEIIRSRDIAVFVISEPGDDISLLEELGQKIHRLLKHHSYHKYSGIFERSLLADLHATIRQYELRYIGKNLEKILGSSYSWIEDKDLAKLIEVILLGGRIEGPRDIMKILNHLGFLVRKSICPINIESEYYWKLSENRKINTCAPGKLRSHIGKTLRKGQVFEIINLARQIYFTAFEIKQIWSKKTTPVDFVNILENRVKGIYKLDEHIVRFAAYLVSTLFRDINNSGEKIEKMILRGDLIRGF